MEAYVCVYDALAGNLEIHTRNKSGNHILDLYSLKLCPTTYVAFWFIAKSKKSQSSLIWSGMSPSHMIRIYPTGGPGPRRGCSNPTPRQRWWVPKGRQTQNFLRAKSTEKFLSFFAKIWKFGGMIEENLKNVVLFKGKCIIFGANV